MTAPTIEPHASWLPLQERAAATENPLHKTLLTEVALHMEAGIKGQLEPLMATLTAEPVYHFWRLPVGNMVLRGYTEVAGFYSNMFNTGGNQFEVVNRRILVEDQGVITEGQVKQVYTREALSAMGVTDTANGSVQDQPLWLSCAQLITVWPAAADNKLVGEDIYFGEDPMTTLVPIAESALPDYYQL
ncbi:MAG: hypothetical protein AAF993_15925 [Pseudomonadota bacterium]